MSLEFYKRVESVETGSACPTTSKHQHQSRCGPAAEKKGQPTTYYLSAAPEPIRINCEYTYVDVVLSPDPAVFGQRNDEFYAHYQAGTLDIHDYVRFATCAARERGAAEAAQAHARYMDEVIRPRITPEALALVRSHQHAGDTVMIVTATNEFVTRPIAQAFGVFSVICHLSLGFLVGAWSLGQFV